MDGNNVNVSIRQKGINWEPIPESDESDQVSFKGTFENLGKKYEITVSYNSTVLQTEEFAGKDFNTAIQDALDRIDDLNELAQLSDYTLKTNLKDLQDKNIKVFKGDTLVADWTKEAKLSKTVKTIQKVFREIFSSVPNKKEEMRLGNQTNISFEEEKELTIEQEFTKKTPQEIKPPKPQIVITKNQIDKALKLHKMLSSNRPKLDSKTGLTTCTTKQFKAAVKLLKTQFPEVSKYKNPKDNIVGSQILQLILTGKHTELKDDKCFILSELDGAKTPSRKLETEGNSFPLYNLKCFEGDPINKFTPAILKKNLNAIVPLFEKDCFDRTLNFISLDGKPTQIGGKNNQSPQFIKEVNNTYTQFLMKNPNKAKEIVKNNKQSDLFNLLIKHGKELELPYQEDENKSLFSEKVMLKILEKNLMRYLPMASENEVVKSFCAYALNNVIIDQSMEQIAEHIAKEKNLETANVLKIIEENWSVPGKKDQEKYANRRYFAFLQQIILFSRMEPKMIQTLAEKTQLPIDQIEPLLRMKTFEMLLFINQSTTTIPSGPMSHIGMNYKNPLDKENKYVSVPPSTKKAIFEFSKDFTNLKMTLYWEMILMRDHLELEGYKQTEEVPKVAQIESVLSMPTASNKNTAAPTLSLMGNPIFSWKMTDNYLEYLTKLLKSEKFLNEFAKDQYVPKKNKK